MIHTYKKQPIRYNPNAINSIISVPAGNMGAINMVRIAMACVATTIINHAPLIPFSIVGLFSFMVMEVKNVYVIMNQQLTAKIHNTFAMMN